MSGTHTPGPWFVSGVRFKMNGGEWHNINRYDEAKKTDENIACVGYNPRIGLGFADAHLIAAAPELLRCAEILAGLEGKDGGRTFPTKEDCAFSRSILSKARGGAA